VASYYGKEFHGKTTASGIRFDMNAMVAAHPNYPFGTLLRVTNLANGRSTRVRI
jgi:rare lipoprotein A